MNFLNRSLTGNYRDSIKNFLYIINLLIFRVSGLESIIISDKDGIILTKGK